VNFLSGSTVLAPSAHAGTMTLTGATFVSTGTNTATVNNGVSYDVLPITTSGPTIQVTASITYNNLPYGNNITMGTPDVNSRQRILMGGASSLSALSGSTTSAAIASANPFAPIVSTQANDATLNAGDTTTDEITVSVATTTENPTGAWGVYDDGTGTLLPIPVTITSTLWKDAGDSPIIQQATIPTTAVAICTVSLIVTAPGVYTTPDCLVTSGGYLVWTEAINPADTAIAEGSSKIVAWQSEYGISTEAVFAPFAPSITSQTSNASPEKGACISDVLTITNSNTTAVDYEITSHLIGPMSSQPVPGTVLTSLTGQTIAGTVTTTITGNGVFTTPCVTVNSYGYYFWVYESAGSTDLVIPAFNDLSVYGSETSNLAVTKLASTGVSESQVNNPIGLASGFFGVGGAFLFAASRRKKVTPVESPMESPLAHFFRD
jgi:hypothetical protein